jgi:hypothetical protein
MHDHSLYWLEIGTLLKSGAFKPVLRAQCYNMRRWRFWLETETILQHEMLEVLAWDRDNTTPWDVGGSDLGQRRWRFWLRTETLEVLVWDRDNTTTWDVGGSGLRQRQYYTMRRWRFWLGTETLQDLAVVVLSLSQARTSNVSCCSIVSVSS